MWGDLSVLLKPSFWGQLQGPLHGALETVLRVCRSGTGPHPADSGRWAEAGSLTRGGLVLASHLGAGGELRTSGPQGPAVLGASTA